MMRTYTVNGVEMYKCLSCGKLFPFDKRTKVAYCEACCSPRPEPETQSSNRFIYPEYSEELRKINEEYSDELRKNIREGNRRRYQKYRSLKKQLPADFSDVDWTACKSAFDNRCAYCGKKRKLAQEHFKPINKGGPYTVDNIVPSCKSCNSSKHDYDFAEWYPQQPFYDPERERKILKYLREASS